MSKLIRKSNKGFTLIELMIVVAIIGILAAIAIPNFLRFQLKAKSSEGKVNIAAIRTAEESYLAEFGVYVAAPLAPIALPGSSKVLFVEAAPAAANSFNTLGWAPEGQVFFQYGVNATAANVPQAYTITATADIDASGAGAGSQQSWGYVKPSAATPLAGLIGLDAFCLTTGVWDAAATAATSMTTVAPCNAASGQSVF
jgi:type IV pilus assembly protein PilA